MAKKNIINRIIKEGGGNREGCLELRRRFADRVFVFVVVVLISFVFD